MSISLTQFSRVKLTRGECMSLIEHRRAFADDIRELSPQEIRMVGGGDLEEVYWDPWRDLRIESPNYNDQGRWTGPDLHTPTAAELKAKADLIAAAAAGVAVSNAPPQAKAVAGVTAAVAAGVSAVLGLF